jgi:hypothetical protein
VLPGIKVDTATVETNLVVFDLTEPLCAPTAVERRLDDRIHLGPRDARMKQTEQPKKCEPNSAPMIIAISPSRT